MVVNDQNICVLLQLWTDYGGCGYLHHSQALTGVHFFFFLITGSV